MKKVIFAVLAAAAVFVFMACNSGNPTTLEEMIAAGTVVARVDGLDVMAGDVAMMKEQASFALQFDFDREIDDWEYAVLEDAVELAALFILMEDYAERNDIALTDEERDEIQQNIQFMVDDFGDEFDEILAGHNIFGMDHLIRYFEVFQLMGKTIQSIIETPTLFAEFEHLMEPAFEPDPNEEVIGVKHILILPDEFESEDEAMEFAHGIRARAVAGEDFDALIVEYGNDPGMMWSPDGYFFTMGAFNNPLFEGNSAALAIGEIGEPYFDPSFGIHIIKRIPPENNPNPDDIMRPGGLPPTDEERQIGAIHAAFEARIEAADIVFLPALYEMVYREEGWEQLQIVQ